MQAMEDSKESLVVTSWSATWCRKCKFLKVGGETAATSARRLRDDRLLSFPYATTARCDVQYLVSLLPDAFTPAPS